MSRIVLLSQLPEHVRQRVESGDPGKIRCPLCDGGRTGEISLSIYGVGNGAVRLKCWRAGCGWNAMLMTDPTVTLERDLTRPPKIFREPMRRFGRSKIATMCEVKYGITAKDVRAHGWKLSGDGDDTLVMPILSSLGRERGHLTRTFDTPKKCYTYKATSEPFLDWWPWQPTGELQPATVIVEDCLSAARLYRLGYQAVALLGTGMTVEQAREIADMAEAADDLFLALDRDAFAKATKLANRHRHIADMKVVCLPMDVKNMKLDSDIHSIFGAKL